jgi:hypothetical protein
VLLLWVGEASTLRLILAFQSKQQAAHISAVKYLQQSFLKLAAVIQDIQQFSLFVTTAHTLIWGTDRIILISNTRRSCTVAAVDCSGRQIRQQLHLCVLQVDSTEHAETPQASCQ